jgi:hypothetical protein
VLWFCIWEIWLRGTSSVVHENIESPEALLYEGDHRPHVCLDSYIGQDKGSTTTVCLNLAHGLYAAVLIYIGDDNRRALTRQSHCYRTTDAGTSTCDERDSCSNVHD